MLAKFPPIFVADTKLNFGYSFVASLRVILRNIQISPLYHNESKGKFS